jgi:hypothetical protein
MSVIEAKGQRLIKIRFGLLNYVHSEDDEFDGQIKRLGDRLEEAIRHHWGDTFQIALLPKYMDSDARWKWITKIALSEVILLIPVVTPTLLQNKSWCKEVLALRSIQLTHHGYYFVVPIYYVNSELMNSEAARANAIPEVRTVATLLSAQYEDWRELRLRGENLPAYNEGIDRFAQRAVETLLYGTQSL